MWNWMEHGMEYGMCLKHPLMDNYVTMPTVIRPRGIPCSCNLPVPVPILSHSYNRIIAHSGMDVFTPTHYWAASTKHCLIIFDHVSGWHQLISSDNYATMLLPIWTTIYRWSQSCFHPCWLHTYTLLVPGKHCQMNLYHQSLRYRDCDWFLLYSHSY